MSATLIIIAILVIISLLLFAVEAFVIPGMGFAGIGAAVCVGVSALHRAGIAFLPLVQQVEGTRTHGVEKYH